MKTDRNKNIEKDKIEKERKVCADHKIYSREKMFQDIPEPTKEIELKHKLIVGGVHTRYNSCLGLTEIVDESGSVVGYPTEKDAKIAKRGMYCP